MTLASWQRLLQGFALLTGAIESPRVLEDWLACPASAAQAASTLPRQRLMRRWGCHVGLGTWYLRSKRFVFTAEHDLEAHVSRIVHEGLALAPPSKADVGMRGVTMKLPALAKHGP